MLVCRDPGFYLGSNWMMLRHCYLILWMTWLSPPWV